MYHEIILLFLREALSSCLYILGEKLVNVIYNNSFLSDVRLLAILDCGRCVLGLGHTRKNLLNENNFVLSFNSLEPADEVFITFPWTNLAKTIEVEKPFIIVSKNIRDELGKIWISALDPLSWVYTLRHILKFLRKKIIQLSVNHTFG